MKNLILFLTLFIALNTIRAQELNCQVSVIPTPALQIGPVEKEIFTEMENSMTRLLCLY